MRARRYELSQRPPNFTINPEHPWVAKDELVFAGLGNAPGGLVYHDSSRDHLGGQGANHGLGNYAVPATATSGWAWDNFLGRGVTNFDGINDYVVIGNVLSWKLSIPCSVGLWFKHTTTSNLVVVEKTAVAIPGWSIQTHSSPTLHCNFGGTGSSARIGTTLAAVYNGSWHHALFVAKNTGAGNGVCYIDGVDMTSDNTPKTTTYDTTPAYIGSRGGSYAYPGGLSDILLFNKALSASDAKTLADPSNPMLSNLILPPKRRLYAVASVTSSRRRRLLCSV